MFQLFFAYINNVLDMSCVPKYLSTYVLRTKMMLLITVAYYLIDVLDMLDLNRLRGLGP